MSDVSPTPEGGPAEEVNRDAFGIEPPENAGPLPQAEEPLPGTPEKLAQDLAAVFEERQAHSKGEAGGEAPSPPAEPPQTQEVDHGAPVPEPERTPEANPPVPEPAAPPAATTEVIPPVIPAAGPQVNLEEAFRQQYGRIPTQTELHALFQWQSDVQRLAIEDPQRFAQLEALMYGEAQQQVTGQTPAAPTASPMNGPVDDEPDPYLEQAVAPLRDELGQVRSYLEQQEQQRIAEHQAQVAAQITAGGEKFASEFALTDAESEALQNAVVNSGIMAGLYSAHGDGEAAMYQAMSQMYWSTPEFRAREFEKKTHEHAVEEADLSQRKAKAGAVAGTSGSVTRDEPVPQTKAGRLAAMASEIKTAQSQGG